MDRNGLLALCKIRENLEPHDQARFDTALSRLVDGLGRKMRHIEETSFDTDAEREAEYVRVMEKVAPPSLEHSYDSWYEMLCAFEDAADTAQRM